MRIVMTSAVLVMTLFTQGYIESNNGKTTFNLGLKQAHAEETLPDVAERVVKSVVNVSSSRKSRMKGPGQDPFFRHFFGRGGRMPERRGQSLGSGVVVDSDGLILTNNHVVEGGDEISITTSEGRKYEAVVVGTDAKSDVAVLRIKGEFSGLVPMAIGDSDAIRLGETVLAIGNPFGLSHTVTMGIVSAKGRANVGITDYENFIQTDAAINPGNSGGALVNTRGELVGINTAIASRSGGYQGIGFAIPSLMAQDIMGKLVTDGSVKRGWLGISIQSLTTELAEQFGVPDGTRGVLVSDVLLDSPAEGAGLRSGDIILEVEGRKMSSPAQLRNEIASRGADAEVNLLLIREGKRRSDVVELGLLPDGKAPRSTSQRKRAKGELGLRLEDLDESLRRRLKLEPSVTGALVSEVQVGSPAHRSGLRSGDVIVEARHKKVGDVRGLRRILVHKKGDILVRFRRGRSTLFCIIRR